MRNRSLQESNRTSAGTFLTPTLGGSFNASLLANGQGPGTYSVYVNFTPAPEPAGVLAACAAAAAAGWVRRRRRPSAAVTRCN